MKKRAGMLSLFFTGVLFLWGTGFAVEHSTHYFGLNTEFKKYDMVSLFQGDRFFESTAFDFTATYGPPFMTPFRFRAGVGFYDFQSFFFVAGMEIPIWENLNDFQAKRWGFYLVPEVEIGFTRWDVLVRCEALIPLSMIGGIQLGIGINRELKVVFSISYSAGLYPLVD